MGLLKSACYVIYFMLENTDLKSIMNQFQFFRWKVWNSGSKILQVLTAEGLTQTMKIQSLCLQAKTIV